MTTVLVTTTGANSFTIPAGVTSITFEAWGAGGGSANLGTTNEPGGGGGAYISATLAVTPGDIIYFNVGAGAAAATGGESWFQKNVNSTTNAWRAFGGSVPVNATGGAFGAPSAGTVGTQIAAYYGGNGGDRQGGGGSRGGGGGGGAAGPLGAGGDGSPGSGSSGGAGGTGNGGNTATATASEEGAGARPGGNGGAAAFTSLAVGSGAGGSGSSNTTSTPGARGQIRYTYELATAVLEQKAFRFYAEGTESGSTALEAQNTNISLQDIDAQFIQLRVMLQETSGASDAAGGSNYALRVSKNGGAYTTVTSNTGVVGYNSSNLTDGAATTNRLTGGTGTFQAGVVDDPPTFTSSISFLHEASKYTEHLFSLELWDDGGVAVGDTLDFRVYRDGVALPTYTVTPRITIVATPSPGDAAGAMGATVTVSAMGGTALGGADAEASPPLSGTTVTAMGGTAAGGAGAGGALNTVTMSAMAAVLSADVNTPRNLIVNGDGSSTDGWLGTATLSLNAGRLRVDAGGSNNMAYQVIATVVGLRYRVEAEHYNISAEIVRLRAGTTIYGTEYGFTDGGATTNHVEFVATTTTTYITLLPQNGGIAEYDNITAYAQSFAPVTATAMGGVASVTASIGGNIFPDPQFSTGPGSPASYTLQGAAAVEDDELALYYGGTPGADGFYFTIPLTGVVGRRFRATFEITLLPTGNPPWRFGYVGNLGADHIVYPSLGVNVVEWTASTSNQPQMGVYYPDAPGATELRVTSLTVEEILTPPAVTVTGMSGAASGDANAAGSLTSDTTTAMSGTANGNGDAVGSMGNEGPELVTNGDASNGLTGWANQYGAGTPAGTLTVEGDRFKVTNDQQAGMNYAYQNVTGVLGKTYRIRAKHETNRSNSNQFRIMSANYSAVYASASAQAGTTFLINETFVHSGTHPNLSIWLGIAQTFNNADIAYFDDVTLREVVPVSVTAMGGTAEGVNSSPGDAAGALSGVTVTALAGAASGDANVSPALVTSTSSAMDGTATGTASITAALSGITVTALAGTATGGTAANASGALSTVTLSALAGSVVGHANITAALVTSTSSAMEGAATGGAGANGALTTVTVTAMSGSASGATIVNGDASGALSSVTVTALAGAASGDAAINSALVSVTLSALEATLTTDGSVTAALAGVTVTALEGSASSVAGASGSLETVTITALTGTASGAGEAAGALQTVTTTALEGSANGSANNTSALPTSTVTALGGAGSGAANISVELGAVSVSALNGAANGSANSTTGQFSDVTITFMGGSAAGDSSIPGNASGNLAATVTISELGAVVTNSSDIVAALSTSAVTAMGGTASGGAVGEASGALAGTTVTAMDGTASGGAGVAGLFADVIASSMGGDAIGSASSDPALPIVYTSSIVGEASGDATASGAAPTFVVTNLEGAASADANINSTLSQILITALEANVAADSEITGLFSDVIITAMGGSAFSNSYGPFTITVRDARGVTRSVGPFLITG